MVSFAFLLSICVVICYANAQYQPYYDDRVYYYPNYPVGDGRTPNALYDDRFLFRTLTTTATSTTTTTCTVYTDKNCIPGRRRRRFVEEEDDSIVPSPVDKSVTKIKTLKASTFSTCFSLMMIFFSRQS
jgi:hypothetical protein